MENSTKAIITLLLSFSALSFSYYLGYSKAASKADLMHSRAIAEEQKRLLDINSILQKKNYIALGNKDNEFKKIIDSRDALIVELRKRPKRSEQTVVNPPSSSSCTGRELYGEDAEFLAREAARADKIKAERDYYYEMYKQVREILNGN